VNSKLQVLTGLPKAIAL